MVVLCVRPCRVVMGVFGFVLCFVWFGCVCLVFGGVGGGGGVSGVLVIITGTLVMTFVVLAPCNSSGYSVIHT